MVASFLALLLLTTLYQAFGEVARLWRAPRARPPFEEILLEEALFRWQFEHLRAKPKILEEGRFLALPLKTPLGPLWAIYDLEKGRYAEVRGFSLPNLSALRTENIVWMKGGLASLKLYWVKEEEKEELPLDHWPSKKPLLIMARFISGGKATLLFFEGKG